MQELELEALTTFGEDFTVERPPVGDEGVIQVRGMASALEQRQVLEVLPALPRPPFVAFLVLGADQAVRPAAAIGRQVEVGLGPTNAVLDMAAVGFCGLQYPGLPLGSARKRANSVQFLQRQGVWLPGANRPAAPGLGGPEAQVRDARHPQPLDRTRALHPAAANQSTNCRNEDGIEAVGLWSGQDVVHRPLGQRPVDRAEAGQQIDDGGRAHFGPALPGTRPAPRGRGRPEVPRPAWWRRPRGRTRAADPGRQPFGPGDRHRRRSWWQPSRPRCAQPRPLPAAAVRLPIAATIAALSPLP